MTHRARKTAGINVAFIDVMSCGLGALMLILILAKYKTELPEDQSNALDAELAQLQGQNQKKGQSVDELQAQISARNADLAGLVGRLQSVRDDVAAQKALNESLRKQAGDLEEQAAAQNPAPIPISGERLQNYLLGLRVEGEKIVMLIDSSASMADERLIDIIKYKVSSRAKRSRAPKWRRTKRIADWLVAQVPAGSDYMVVGFAEKAAAVGGSGWKKGADVADAAAVKTALGKVIPEGGTNLGAAIAALRHQAAGFTDVYIVTDGLPTRGDKKLSSFFSGCASIVGRSASISGECRAKLLEKIVSDYTAPAKVNVILLPLEGDPLASSAFWRWTSSTRGLLISPEASWP